MKSKRLFFFSFFLFLLAGCCYYLSFPSIKRIENSTQKKIKELEYQANISLDSIYEKLNQNNEKEFFHFLSTRFVNTFNKTGVAFFVYENDSLQFWTDNHPAVENYMLNVCLEKKIVKLKNGYYQVVRHHKNTFSTHQLYALILIKNNYAYQNKYLKNIFNPYLELPSDYEIVENKAVGSTIFNISNVKGEYLFSIDATHIKRNRTYAFFSFLLLYIALLLLLYAFKKQWNVLQSITAYLKWLGLLTFGVVFLYVYLFCLKGFSLLIPSAGGEIYSIFPVFACCTLVFMIWALWDTKQMVKAQVQVRSCYSIFFSLYTAGLYLFGFLSYVFLLHIFKNASLLSDLADVFFYPSTYVYVCYSCAVLLFWCAAWYCEVGFYLFFSKTTHLKKYVVIFLVASIFSLCLQKYFSISFIWIGVFFVLLVFSAKQLKNNPFLYGIVVCLILSFIGAYTIVELKNKVDYKQRISIAKSLLNPKDKVVENLFESISGNLVLDKELKKIIVKKSKNTNTLNAEQYILQKYFMGYWERYQVSVCLFDSLCMPLVPQTNQYFNNNAYFDDVILQKLIPTNSKGLYFNNALKDKTYYLFKQNLPFSHKPYLLYIVVQSKNTPTYNGFPDLLLNQSAENINADYSYAIYKEGWLQEKQGVYSYANYIDYQSKQKKSFNKNGYNHIVYSFNDKTTILVSKNYTYFNDLSATISFLFLLASMAFLLFSILNTLLFHEEHSLAIKIQHYVSIGVLFLFIPVVVTAFTIARKQIETQNIDVIREKIQTVSNYINVQLNSYEALNADDKEYTAYVLRQASDIFKSDITLFKTNGEYYTAALPRLFDDGIISKKINPEVYAAQININYDKKVYNENVGNLHFYSAYSDITNAKKKKLAILNLPYFSEQDKIQAQLFGYLSSLFNIYVLAFMFIVVAAALLANWLTTPLQKLQTQIKKVTLQQNNEPIYYNKSDEIGLLIASYNSMLIKLQQSADQLLKSEREGAWKEMARQVAHEIKNPLTPMKLSIQHIERLLHIQPEEAGKQAQKIIPILIEQIDALAHIATEFSSFAQLPAPNFDRVDLLLFLQNNVPLYQTNTKVTIQFTPCEGPAFVHADTDQLLRVLNNLINNAVQAIDENKKGTVILHLEKQHQAYLLSVSDNGSGIKEEMKTKIFQPNFSTKSYGTGLGLAICRRIIEQHNGSIWFESTEGIGTTFYVKLNNYQA
ncbi:MAG: HAMP domain-containing histidine kinase [Bacteroidetes bacterium]|nr:HAMP domain-containing histidine kinase [Bacteroidota bacterium]